MLMICQILVQLTVNRSDDYCGSLRRNPAVIPLLDANVIFLM
jgi:hypothetical protein